jgi:PEGA domain
MNSRASWTAACALLVGASCQTVERPISFSSDPPGARVVIDGHDSGFVTPCLLQLERERTAVRFELDGYKPEDRVLRPDMRRGTLFWREMSVSYRTWNFPLWLNRDDFLTPYKRDKSLVPNRLFVRLKREADVRREMPESSRR